MIEIRPIKQAVGDDNPDRQISVIAWNQGHQLTASPNMLVGTDAAGAAKEYPVDQFATDAELAAAIGAIPPPPDLSGYVTDLELSTALANYALVAHTHPISDIAGLQAALDAKADDSDLAGYAT